MLPQINESGIGRSSFLSRKSHDASGRPSARYSTSTTYPSSGNSLRARLATRSRVTNLGIGLLVTFASFSLLLNLIQFSRFTSSSASTSASATSTSTKVKPAVPKSLTSLAQAPRPGAEKLDHLVIVVGHAVWMGSAFEGRLSDDNWVLEDYQKGGSVRTFWKHIKRGIEIANKDSNALLMFSGGQTRPRSLATEAESYFQLALQSHMDLPVLTGADVVLKTTGENGAEFAEFNDADRDGTGENALAAVLDEDQGRKKKTTTQVVPEHAHLPAADLNDGTTAGLDSLRMTTETFALDSFENLLFSIARFREFTTRYPERITVVGYGMKKERFEKLHAKALRWPTTSLYKTHRRFFYVGFDDDGDTTEQYQLEKQNGFALFDKDMYGCHGELLEKRQLRNPARRFPPYILSAPEMAGLLDWCPKDGIGLQGVYRLSLPWDQRMDEEWGFKADEELHQSTSTDRPRKIEFSREQD